MKDEVGGEWVWPFSARGDKCDKCDKGHVGKGQGSGLARRLLSGVFARRAGRRGTLGPHLVFHACQCSPVLYCSFRPTGQSLPVFPRSLLFFQTNRPVLPYTYIPIPCPKCAQTLVPDFKEARSSSYP
jgi:hypothetical protein